MTSLTARLSDLWAVAAAAEAVHFDGGWWRWGELVATADALDRQWQAAGVGSDARIAVVLENRPEFIAVVLAILKTRRCLTTVSPLQPTPRLVADLRTVRPRVLVASPGVWGNLIDAGFAEEIELRFAISPTGEVAVSGSLTAALGADDLAEGTAIEMLTSGTTGPAKRVRLSYRQVDSALASVRAYDPRPEVEGGELPSGVALSANPLVHIGGLWGVLQALCNRRRLVLLDRFQVASWVDAVRRFRPKLGSLTPAAIKMVLDADVPAEALSSLRAVNSGAAPLAPELADRFTERYGVAVLSVYGATEFCGAVAGWELKTHQKYWKSKHGSVGRAQPGTELRVVDDDGKVLAPGSSGILHVRTAQSSAGADVWTPTRDRARIDEDGFLWIEGRADDTIIRGGFKVRPATVTSVLEKHPAVREAAVAGRPDERLGQVPVAAVELAGGHEAPSQQDLIGLCRKELLPYEVPVEILVVDALPRTPSMKISHVDLLNLFEPEEDDLGRADN